MLDEEANHVGFRRVRLGAPHFKYCRRADAVLRLPQPRCARAPRQLINVRYGSVAVTSVSASKAEFSAKLIVCYVPKADLTRGEILLRLDLPPSAAAQSDAQC